MHWRVKHIFISISTFYFIIKHHEGARRTHYEKNCFLYFFCYCNFLLVCFPARYWLDYSLPLARSIKWKMVICNHYKEKFHNQSVNHFLMGFCLWQLSVCHGDWLDVWNSFKEWDCCAIIVIIVTDQNTVTEAFSLQDAEIFKITVLVSKGTLLHLICIHTCTWSHIHIHK